MIDITINPQIARVSEMAALDSSAIAPGIALPPASLQSCLRGISASLHKITPGGCVMRVLATAIIAIARLWLPASLYRLHPWSRLVKGVCARITQHTK